MIMDESLTPDEEAVLRELERLDVEPNQIPVALQPGFMQRLARSCHMSLARAKIAMQGLINKGVFDTIDEGLKEGEERG